MHPTFLPNKSHIFFLLFEHRVFINDQFNNVGSAGKTDSQSCQVGLPGSSVAAVARFRMPGPDFLEVGNFSRTTNFSVDPRRISGPPPRVSNPAAGRPKKPGVAPLQTPLLSWTWAQQQQDNHNFVQATNLGTWLLISRSLQLTVVASPSR